MCKMADGANTRLESALIHLENIADEGGYMKK